MSEKGQVLIIALIFMVVVTVLATGLLGFVGQNVKATRTAVAREQAVQLAEAGIDKAVWQLNETGGSYPGETGTVLGTGVFDVTIETISGVLKEITATGYVPDKTDPEATRVIKVQTSIDAVVVNFNYGVQVGEGGLEMDQNSRVNGNIYSNGIVTGANGAIITGDAFSAGPGGLIDDLQIDGTAYANTIQNSTVGGDAKGTTLTNTTVGGDVFENSISTCTIAGNASYTTKVSCTITGSEITPYAGEPDPDALDFPISDQQITDWKNEAEAGGTIAGDYVLNNSQEASLGPKKITGDLFIDNLAKLTLTGRIWVQGNVTISNNAILALDASYGNLSEAVIGDGVIDVANNAVFQRAGANSYIMMLTTASGSVFTLANNADSLIAYAPNGDIDVSNNAQVREVTAYKIKLDNNAIITYESGLANSQFSSGPGASWIVVRGTWREIK